MGERRLAWGDSDPDRNGSSQQIVHDLAGDVGQAHVASAEAVGQALMVEAEQMQDGRVQIVDVNFVLDGVVAESSVAP